MRKALRGLPLIIVLLITWELLSRTGVFDPVFVPPPSEVASRFWYLLFTKKTLIADLNTSLIRVGAGFALTVAFAIPSGIVLGINPKLEERFDLLIQICRPIPPPAWVPLALIWFKMGNQSAIFVVFAGTVLSTLLGIIFAVRSVPADYIENAKAMGAKRLDLIRYVILPASAPGMLSQLRQSAGLAWMCVVAAELVGVRSGLGFMIIDAWQLFRSADVIVGMLVIGFIGLGLDIFFRAVEKKLFPWHYGTGSVRALSQA